MRERDVFPCSGTFMIRRRRHQRQSTRALPLRLLSYTRTTDLPIPCTVTMIESSERRVFGDLVESVESQLMSREDRFVQTGHAFYVATYKILVDWDKIDGMVEMAWRGKNALYGTTGGVLGSRSERYAFTAQLNRRLDLAVSSALKNGVPHIHDDGV